MVNLSLMLMIYSKKNEAKYNELLDRYNVKFKVLTYGMGTASSSLLEYFGLNEIKREVLISVMPYNMSKHILKCLETEYEISSPGNGIAFTIPVSSSTKYMSDIYKEDLEDVKMSNSNKHLIVTIANEGSAEDVMNAAKKAGATGGTALNGRGLDTEKIIKFLGISIEPEKDIVIILADEDKKNNIMDSIVKNCGLRTVGAGICFSIPVSHVVGLKTFEE